MTPTDPWKEWVTIHFKEDSIPGLRSGQLTEESIAVLKALALKEALEIIGNVPDESEVWRYSGDMKERFRIAKNFKDHYGGSQNDS